MNLRLIFSRSRREVWVMSDLRSVMTRFLVPGQHPYASRLASLEKRGQRTNLDHDKVVLDDTVANEASHGGDGLDGRVKVGGSGRGVLSFPKTVDLLVEPAQDR